MTLYNCIFHGFPGDLVILFLVLSTLTRFHVFIYQLKSGNTLLNLGQSDCSVGSYERPSTWRDLYAFARYVRFSFWKQNVVFVYLGAFFSPFPCPMENIRFLSSYCRRPWWKDKLGVDDVRVRCASLDTKTVGGARNILSARTQRCETRGDCSSSFSSGRV